MSERQELQETTGYTSEMTRADVLTRFQEKENHPRWLGDSPRLQFPPGTMFGSLQLLSDELVRVSSVRQHGKLKGKKRNDIYVRCLCTKCGREYMANKNNLLRGLVTQCKRCNVKQGHETRLRNIWGGVLPDSMDRYLKGRWDAIKSRTEDPTHRSYGRYGGRGIKLSEEFQDPRVFVSYVRSLPDAERAKELQIDRIDNSKGYERGNLRWVTPSVNSNNRDVTVKVTYDGEKMPLADFIREHTDLSYEYVRSLIKRGISPRKIASWVKNPLNVTYKGESMSLMEFSRRHVSNMSYNNVLKLHKKGYDLDEIIRWEKKSHDVCYKGVEMRFRSFVSKYTELSYPYASRLRREGRSLDELAEWKKRR